MTKLDLANKNCVPSLQLLGDFWTLRIIDALSEGQLHYCELQRHVDNLNPVTLTSRLKKLEKAKFITRQEESKTNVSYKLSNLGIELLPVLSAINTFSNKTSQS